MTLEEKIDQEISKYKVCVLNKDERGINRSYEKIESYVINAMYNESCNTSYSSYTTQDYVVQDMRLELLNAIPKYDPSKGVKFLTYFTDIMKRYRFNSFGNVENIYKQIHAYYPERKKRNTMSYDDIINGCAKDSPMTFMDILVDTKANTTEDTINCMESLNSISKLDDLDKLILSTIISDDSAINVVNKGKSHKLNREYIQRTCNINKSGLQSKLSRYRKMNLVERLMKDVYRGIEDLPKVSTLDNLVYQSLDLDEMINAIAI